MTPNKMRQSQTWIQIQKKYCSLPVTSQHQSL
jgi:hypothetical protein